MTNLTTLLSNSTYTSYSYAYPHKTAYRPLDPPEHLSTVWAQEKKQHYSSIYISLFVKCGVDFATYLPKQMQAKI